MFSIGEISKTVNISVDALRYYDEIGLLKPCHIEKESRYRYYSTDQVKDLLFIIEMKQYGFSLDAIKELLKTQDNHQLLSSFHLRLKELYREKAGIEQSLDSLKRRITEFESEEKNMKQETILVADDSAFMRMMLNDILEKHNYKVVGEALTGEESVEKFKSLAPDIVTMDINMGEHDGITAVRRIRGLDSKVKIVMLSAMGLLPIILESIVAGGDDFIVKPFQAENLLVGISKVIESRRSYNIEFMSRLLADKEFIEECPKTPLSQDNINKLFDLCCSKPTPDIERMFEFIKDLKQEA